jgi:hypothetical protein
MFLTYRLIYAIFKIIFVGKGSFSPAKIYIICTPFSNKILKVFSLSTSTDITVMSKYNDNQDFYFHLPPAISGYKEIA